MIALRRIPQRSIIRNLSSFQSPNLPTKYPTPSAPLTTKLTNTFVNIMIDSKYYHTPLPTRVDQILAMLQSESKLNQKTVLLQHLTDIITANMGIILTHNQRAKVIKQLNLWKGRGGYRDKVATVAWTIAKLDLFKQCQDLYLEIAGRFQNDQWYPNLDESVKALQAFVYLPDQQQKAYIYPRIQANISKTIWEENLKMYQRVVVGLLLSGRVDSPLWGKLQDYIMRNLGMQYSLKTITDIFSAYALAHKGSDIFFQMIQKAIYLGHWYNYQLKHRILPGYDQPGEFYALLVETYSIVHKNTQIYLLPNFLEYVYKGVADRQTGYQKLGSFTKLVEHLPGLFEEEDQQEVLGELLENKKPMVVDYRQIMDFYRIVEKRGITLPKQLQKHIEQSLINDIRRQLIPPAAVLELCEELLENNYVLDQNRLWQTVQESLSLRIKYLEGQEAKEMLHLSQISKHLPEKTRKLLFLPGKGPQN